MEKEATAIHDDINQLAEDARALVAATAKPNPAQPSRATSQSQDKREDRGTRQIKTSRP